jgi:hypothetical protein
MLSLYSIQFLSYLHLSVRKLSDVDTNNQRRALVRRLTADTLNLGLVRVVPGCHDFCLHQRWALIPKSGVFV